MTINQVFEYIEDYHPNTAPQSLKLRWINEAEGYIQREVMLLNSLKYRYSEDNLDATLLAPVPYDRLYIEYLDAQLFYLYHETADYENAAERYNETLKDYAGWYAREYHPARAKNRWRRHGDGQEQIIPPQPIDDGYYYYSSLEAAIADLNSGVFNPDSEKGQAVVRIEAETGTATLLNTTNIADVIELASDMTLNLGGHTIISAADYPFRYNGGNPIEVTINGPGEINVTGDIFAGVVQWGGQDVIAPAESKLTVNGGVYVSTGTQTMSNCIRMIGGQLLLRNAEVYANGSGDADTFVIAVMVQNGATATLEGCTVQGYYNGSGNAHTIGIYNLGGFVTARNCNITVDAPYTCYNQATDRCVDTDAILAALADGFSTLTKLYNCNLNGMHSGISNKGTLYIDGGVYQAKGHGGLYAQDSSVNYVKNAALREGNHIGQYVGTTNGSALYLRGSPQVYLDNCLIDSSSDHQHIVMATADAAKLYMSNMEISENPYKFVRMDKINAAADSYIYSGENCNVDATHFWLISGTGDYRVVDQATKVKFDDLVETAEVDADIAFHVVSTSENYAWEEE